MIKDIKCHANLVKIFATTVTKLTIPAKINMREKAPKQMPVSFCTVLRNQLKQITIAHNLQTVFTPIDSKHLHLKLG